MNKLWLRLALPLVVLTTISLYIHTKWPADGLFLNLGTELVGIIITVAYVDWAIKAHERDLWKGTFSRVSNRLRLFSNSTVTGIRVSLGFGTDILDHAVLRSGNENLASAEVMRVATHVLAPAVRNRLEALDVNGWKRLADDLQASWREAERLLGQFGHRLPPSESELLLDMQQAIDSSLTFWRTFPDIAGVPDNDLPTTSTDTVALKSAWNDSTADQLRKVLVLCTLISSRCNQNIDA